MIFVFSIEIVFQDMNTHRVYHLDSFMLVENIISCFVVEIVFQAVNNPLGVPFEFLHACRTYNNFQFLLEIVFQAANKPLVIPFRILYACRMRNFLFFETVFQVRNNSMSVPFRPLCI